MEFKFGVRAHDLGRNTPEKIAAEARRLGFDFVQLVFAKAFEDGSYDPAYVERVRRAFSSVGVRIALLGAYFNPVHSDRSTVEKGIRTFKDNIRIAAELGTDIVGSETGSYNDSPWTYVPKNHTEEGYAQSLSVFKTLLDFAVGHGVGLAVEPAWAHVVYSTEVLEKFVRDLNSGSVYETIDLFNLIYEGNHREHREIFLEVLRRFGPSIRIVHLKDYVIENGKVKQVAPGQGLFDYRFMLESIAEYCSPDVVLIFEGVTGDDLPRSYEYLRRLADEI